MVFSLILTAYALRRFQISEIRRIRVQGIAGTVTLKMGVSPRAETSLQEGVKGLPEPHGIEKRPSRKGRPLFS